MDTSVGIIGRSLITANKKSLWVFVICSVVNSLSLRLFCLVRRKTFALESALVSETKVLKQICDSTLKFEVCIFLK